MAGAKNNASFAGLFGGKDDAGMKVMLGPDGRLSLQRSTDEEDLPPPTPEEIEAWKRQAFLEGEAKGRAEAIAAHEARVAQALEDIGVAIQPMIAALDQSQTDNQRDAAQLAVTIASKLAPALMAREPAAEIHALVESCLGTIKTEPKVVITLAPHMAQALREPLNAQAERRGFTGRLAVAEDEHLNESDVRVEWHGGGAERDMDQVLTAIDSLIARYIGTDASASGHDAHMQN
jgi:flagellar assembly protein FliH